MCIRSRLCRECSFRILLREGGYQQEINSISEMNYWCFLAIAISVRFVVMNLKFAILIRLVMITLTFRKGREPQEAVCHVLSIYMGSFKNYGPFLATLNIRCRIIIRTQKGTIILTTTHIVIIFSMYVEGSGLRALVFSSGCSQVSCWFNPSSVSVLDVGVWLSGDLITNRISDKFEEL